MPSYADSKDGLHIDGVTDNRPAAVAGIQVLGIFLPKLEIAKSLKSILIWIVYQNSNAGD